MTVPYLDGVAASVPGRTYKQRAVDLLDLGPGMDAVDLGCGPGTDLAALADAVGADGTVVGIDRDDAMLATARDRTAGRPWVTLRHGDLHELPLDDAGADRAHTDRVLQHVADPARALAEIRRVLRPGGRVVLAEPDWDALLVDTPDPAAGRGLARFVTTEVVRNATIGRSLARLCAEAGLDVVTVEAHAAVFRDVETAERILGVRRNFARAVRAGYVDAEPDLSGPFLASALIFLTVAERS
ncbi:methyltransferase domain-containing protein [Actinomadura rupiterrae]|uniref:methyltransferase domain-containing protein n=1 Tax=Actinomadura rupiterrae TaxID=559627 RepID=UPI0020A2DE47|nr:methyltransferase domain-containing protein [Actinomadura rupiterrae]MCP2334983.1 SAM-dependent methyltransferase [Actinomadura rupiterrae]